MSNPDQSGRVSSIEEKTMNETLMETVERLIPHICTTGKGLVVVDQLRDAVEKAKAAPARTPSVASAEQP